MSAYKVIYLTGSPATGKTSLCNALKSKIDNLEIINYYELVNEYFQKKYGITFNHDEMRTVSSKKITPDDIHGIDVLLLSKLELLRKTTNIIIDSHAVTKESYGFRAVPFKTEILLKMDLDFIVSLYASSNVIFDRISNSPEGRIITDREEISIHIGLQNALALAYSTTVDCHIYFLNTQQPTKTLVEWFSAKI